MAEREVSKTCEGCGDSFVRAFRPDRPKRFCSRGCRQRRSIEDRFWSKVARGREEGCWIWTGAISRGYGQISVGSKSAGMIPAHRLSWGMHHGAVPPGKWVLHRCDERLCVNPHHLFLGTSDDNIADMVQKKRQAFGLRNARATIDSSTVLAIRAAAEAGINQDDVARRFGVSQSLVSAIKVGRNRRHEH